MKKKIILLAISPILISLMISIVSQYVALHYTKQSINQFCNNLFQEKIYFNSMSTNVVSFRLREKFTISQFQQNATEVNELEILAQEILKNCSYLSPLVKAIGYHNQLNIPFNNYSRIPYQQIIQSTTQDGILFSNFLNSSLSTIDDPSCFKGKFKYDPRCRFWYMNNLNQTSFFMNSPQVSVGMSTPYLSQFGCQKMLFYNSTTNTIQTYKVQCLEAMLTNISSYFQNVIQSSKQYYVIDPRTLSILYNSKKQYDYSTLKQTDNLYNVELQYLQNKTSSQELLNIINQNFNRWTFLTQNKSKSIELMIELTKKIFIIDYYRNTSIYKVIINPVISYDDIPKHISKYTKIQGEQLQYIYLQINMISNEELKAQTNSLIQFSSEFFLIIQIVLGVLALIFLFISAYYAFQITNLIIQPLQCLTQDLNRISELNKMIEISEIIKNFDKNADELFLSLETYLLYRSFFELFECVLYTSENFFVTDQGQTLLELSKRVGFFKKFENNSAVGIIHNNIGNILLNQQHYFQGLEHFSLAIMYAKYEIYQFFNDNNINYLFDNIFENYSFNETISEKPKNVNNQENQISKISAFSLKKKNSSVSETKNQLKINLLNQEKKNSYQNSYLISEATPVSTGQQITLQKNFLSIQKQQNKSRQTIEFNNQITVLQYLSKYYGNNEKEKQFFELIESLKSRMYNYVITLVAFQENIEKNNIESTSFNFWPEIRLLLNDLIKVQSFLPLNETAQALNLCLISKSSSRLFQFTEAEQKFQEAMQIVTNQQKQSNQLNLEKKSEFLFDSRQVSTKKHKDKIQLQNQQIKNKDENFTQIYIQEQSNQQSRQKQFKGPNQFKVESSLTNKFEKIYQSQNIFNFQLANSSVIFSNNSKFNLFSAKKQVQYNNKTPKNQILISNQNQNNLAQSLSCSKRASGFNQRQQIINNILHQEFENLSIINNSNGQQVLSLDLISQFVKFSYAEYFMFRKQYKAAAEILTSLLENSKMLMSHMPYRIAIKIDFTQIFEEMQEFETRSSVSSMQSSNQQNFNCDEYINQNESARGNLVKESSLFHFISDLNKQIIQTDIEGLNKSNFSVDFKNQIKKRLQNQTLEIQNTSVNYNFNQSFQQPILQQNEFIQNNYNNSLKMGTSQKNLITFSNKIAFHTGDEHYHINTDITSNNKTQQTIQFNKNQYFHYFIRTSLNQLFFNTYTFRLAEKNYYYFLKNQKNTKQNNIFTSPQKLYSSTIKNKKNALKFILYQTEKIEILDNCLFKSLCKILRNFEVKILIFCASKGKQANRISQQQRSTRDCPPQQEKRWSDKNNNQDSSICNQSTHKCPSVYNNIEEINNQSNQLLLDEQEQERNEVVQLLPRMFYRKQNYIITLIQFSEQIDFQQNKQKFFTKKNVVQLIRSHNSSSIYNQDIKNYNFWYEIKKLLKDLNKISKLMISPDFQKISIYSYLAKIYFNLNQLSKSQQILKKSQQIFQKFMQKCKDQQQSQKKLTRRISSNKIQNNYQRSSQIQKIREQNHSFPSKFQEIENRQTKSHSITKKILQQQQREYTNKGKQQQHIFIKNQNNESKIQERNIFSPRQNSQQIFNFNSNPNINANSYNKLNLNEIHSPNVSVNNNQNAQKVETHQQTEKKNIQQKQFDEFKNYQIIQCEQLKLQINYIRAEYFIKIQDLRKAAEILTFVLEDNFIIMSHFPYKIIYKLKRIFGSCNVSSPHLDQIYSKEDQQNKRTLQLVSNLVNDVLNKSEDQLGIVLFDSYQQHIYQYIDLNKVIFIKLIMSHIIQDIQNYFSVSKFLNLDQKTISVTSNKSYTDFMYKHENNKLVSPITQLIPQEELEYLELSQESDDSVSTNQQIKIFNNIDNQQIGKIFTQDFRFIKALSKQYSIKSKQQSIDLQIIQLNGYISGVSELKSQEFFENWLSDSFEVQQSNQKKQNQFSNINQILSTQNILSTPKSDIELINHQIFENHLSNQRVIKDNKQNHQVEAQQNLLIKQERINKCTLDQNQEKINQIRCEEKQLKNEKSLDSFQNKHLLQTPSNVLNNISDQVCVEKIIDRNTAFHLSIRKSILQFFNLTFQVYSNKFEKYIKQSQFNQLIQQEYQKNQNQKNNKFKKILVYCTDFIDIKNNNIFKQLCTLLDNNKLQILIFSQKDGDKFLENLQNKTQLITKIRKESFCKTTDTIIIEHF
ncbi:hypothetical protein ABPG72_018231 [Tetrahymena utriculariae]